MIQINRNKDNSEIIFLEKVKKIFDGDLRKATARIDDLEEDSYLALRYGMDNNHIVILKLLDDAKMYINELDRVSSLEVAFAWGSKLPKEEREELVRLLTSMEY